MDCYIAKFCGFFATTIQKNIKAQNSQPPTLQILFKTLVSVRLIYSLALVLSQVRQVLELCLYEFQFFSAGFFREKRGLIVNPKLLLRVNYMLFQNCTLADTKDFVRSSPANSLQKIPNVVAESPFECQLWMVKPSKQSIKFLMLQLNLHLSVNYEW